MACERSERIELDAFLVGAPGDVEVEAFREHYPHCPECAAAVAGWMAVEEAMGEIAAAAGELAGRHPEPEALARHAEASGRSGEAAVAIERHLAGCPRCANELALLERFDPAMFGVPVRTLPDAAHPGERPAEGISRALREALAGFAEQLRRFDLMRPAPALALALIVLAGLWWGGALGRLGDRSPESGPAQFAEQAPPEAEPFAEDGARLAGAEDDSVPIARPDAPAPGSAAEPTLARAHDPSAPRDRDPSPAPGRVPRIEPDPSAVLAEVERKAPVDRAAPDPAPPAPTDPSPSPSPPEEILLAALGDLPPPSYATPEGGDSGAWMRSFGAVRSAPGAANVQARAPGDHTGLTLSPTPRLWWALDRASDLPVQITIVDGEAIDPLVRVELPGPHSAGLHAFDLAQHGARLSPGVDYRWFVAILVDPDRPSRNPVSAGSLRVAEPSDARREQVLGAAASARGNTFAALGLWYDAFDFYASLAAAHPEVSRLATYRDRLAEDVAQAP